MVSVIQDEADINPVIRMDIQLSLPLAFNDFVNIHRRKRFVATGSVSFVVQNFGHLFECFAFLYASWFPAQHFDILDDAIDLKPMSNQQ